ncbi:MAG: cupin domain-containing protein [Syntrophales bacterium]|nr:cupin domain-containing protein [Syntrophales bacterium]
MNTGNIFASVPADMPGELTEMLAGSQTVKIERILSRGHRSPDGFWYDQEQNEWALLLKGRTRLSFEGQADTVLLTAGDYINIPAHVRHRVAWTAVDEETVWLAVHY